MKNLGLGDLEEIQVHLVLCGCQCGHTRVCPFLGLNVTSGPSPSPGGSLRTCHLGYESSGTRLGQEKPGRGHFRPGEARPAGDMAAGVT